MNLHLENLLGSFAEPDESALGRARDLLRAVRGVRSLSAQPLESTPFRQDMLDAVETHLEGRRIQLGEDLLRHLIGGLQQEDAVLFLGAPRLSWHECWAQWAVDPKVGVRPPGLSETYRQIGARLLQQLEAMGLHSDRVALWRARLDFALGEQEQALVQWAALIESRGGFGAQARLERAAAQLERGVPRACLRDLKSVQGVPGSARLAAWAHALLGQAPAVIESLQSEQWPVPAFLVALRERNVDLALPLAGPPRIKGELVAPTAGLVRRASDLGALVLSVHSVRAGFSLMEFAQADPAMQPLLAGWGLARRTTWRAGADPAMEAMATGSTVFDHRTASKPAAALHPEAKSICVVPILAEDGSACGWLHAEWPHAPSVCAARMERITAPWADHMCLPKPDVGATGPREADFGGTQAPFDDPELHAPFQRMMEATNFGLGRRRWYGFLCQDGEPQLVASAGKVLGLEGDWQGARGILARARRLGGPAVFHESKAALSIHKDAVEGIALPLKRGDLLIGYFCLEGTRARDLGEKLVESLSQGVAAAARELEAASFRRLHRQRFHRSIYLPTHVQGFAHLLDRLARASASKGPVLLVGPLGVGKATLSRWCFHLRGRGVARRLDSRAFQRPAGGEGPLLLTEPELLSLEGQALLWDLIQGGKGRDLILSTTSDPIHWKWNSDLLDFVLRCRVDLAALDQRKDELFHWIVGLLQLHAQEESQEAPRLSEDALAGLWRQPWKGGLRQLSEAMSTLVIQANGIGLDLEETLDLLEPMGVPGDRRLKVGPRSYHALQAACNRTRTASGRANLTAIARLMGWDKGTVPGHLQRAGIE